MFAMGRRHQGPTLDERVAAASSTSASGPSKRRIRPVCYGCVNPDVRLFAYRGLPKVEGSIKELGRTIYCTNTTSLGRHACVKEGSSGL